MIVLVVDRAAMASLWGKPHYHVVIKQIEIGDTCPLCGGPRGKPELRRFHELGAGHHVSVWENPCGHIDKYTACLAEASERGIRLATPA